MRISDWSSDFCSSDLSALASIRPLGEYVITVTGNPDTRLDMTLATNKGPLMLEGSGQWTNGQRFVFNGYASAQERSKDALTGLLSQMGRLEGEDRKSTRLNSSH